MPSIYRGPLEGDGVIKIEVFKQFLLDGQGQFIEEIQTIHTVKVGYLNKDTEKMKHTYNRYNSE